MTAEHGGSAPGAVKQPGWFARLPLWVRIAAPIVLVIALAAIVGAALFGTARSVDPAEAAVAACRAAAEERLERRGESDIDVSRSFTETAQADGAIRLQGTATFEEEDGTFHHADLRCIVRFSGDTAVVRSVRFND